MPKSTLEDLGFSMADPSELSFADSAAEDAYTNQLRSDSPATVAQALGIDPAKAEGMDPNAILRMGRSKARTYEAARSNKILTREAQQDEQRGGIPIDKAFLESQVGGLGDDVQSLAADVARTGGKTRDEQQKKWTQFPLEIAGKVTSHDPQGAWRQALDYLTYSKKLDALYFQTQAQQQNQAIARQIKNPQVAAVLNAQGPTPGKRMGPYESYALQVLFDSNGKILPDYLSQGDAQALGLVPGTNLGGAGAGTPPGMVRGTSPSGAPSFSNVGPGTANPQDPTAGQTPGLAPGSVPPDLSVGATAPQALPTGSPSQARMQATGSPELGGMPGFVPSGAPTGGVPPPTNLPAGMVGDQSRQLQFAQAYKAKHPTATGAEIRQAYYAQFGFGG